MPVPTLTYGATAKALHWAVVLLLVIQAPLGWLMPGLRPGTMVSVHLSVGLTVLALIAVRFVWRLTHPVAPESNLPAWQRLGSELVHWVLYLAVLLTTLSGWLYASARGEAVTLVGGVPLPRLVPLGSPLGKSLGGFHATMVWVLIALVSVHVLAALVHLFIYKDRVMYRMLPGEPAP